MGKRVGLRKKVARGGLGTRLPKKAAALSVPEIQALVALHFSKLVWIENSILYVERLHFCYSNASYKNHQYFM